MFHVLLLEPVDSKTPIYNISYYSVPKPKKFKVKKSLD